MSSESDNSYAEEDFGNVSYDVSKRQRYFRRPKKAADMLSQLMARKGYGQTQTRADMDEAWEIAVGPRFIKTTQAGRIKRGVLEIVVANSAVIQQLSFQKRQLLSAMQQQMPNSKIKDLSFSLGNVAKP